MRAIALAILSGVALGAWAGVANDVTMRWAVLVALILFIAALVCTIAGL